MRDRCYICNRRGKDGLCYAHEASYMWDSSIQGFRLKKRNTGSRYTKSDFHKTEIKLTKILEQHYGTENVVTSYHPLWAVSKKDVLYEFDIYIKSKDILIEYDGRQHYEYVKFIQKKYKNFLAQKSRDKRKAKLAKKQGKTLILFRYDEPIFGDYVINKVEKNI